MSVIVFLYVKCLRYLIASTAFDKKIAMLMVIINFVYYENFENLGLKYELIKYQVLIL